MGKNTLLNSGANDIANSTQDGLEQEVELKSYTSKYSLSIYISLCQMSLLLACKETT